MDLLARQIPLSMGILLLLLLLWRRQWQYSSTLAWKIPWTGEPGGLQSVGSLSRARLSNFTFTFHFHALEKEMEILLLLFNSLIQLYICT